VFVSRSLLYCFHICVHWGGRPTLITWVFLPFPLSRDRLGSTPTNGISHLLDINLTRGDKCIQCGWGIRPCPLFGLMPNSFPPVDALEFDTSPILVSLLCGLKNYDIVGSALPVRRSLWSQESWHRRLRFVCVKILDYKFDWTRIPTCCRLPNNFLDSCAPRWCCCRSQLWHPRTSLQI
jgi:hypothetical protein